MQKKDNGCEKCGSKRVMDKVSVIDRNGDYQDRSLSIKIDKNPGALLFKGAATSDLFARVCADCGFVELYAAEPSRLWSTTHASGEDSA